MAHPGNCPIAGALSQLSIIQKIHNIFKRSDEGLI